jgi:hypothetical protein
MRGDEAERDWTLIDERIDAALRSYAEPAELPEARVVLARVMERARAEDPHKRVWWVWGAAVAAGLAMMIALGVVWMVRGPRTAEIAWAPKAPQVAGPPGTSTPSVVRTPLIARSRSKRVQTAALIHERRTVATSRPPKLDTFPTPRPLSPQEESLVAFVHRAPPPVTKAVIADQEHWDDPIIVADLRKPAMGSGSHQD